VGSCSVRAPAPSVVGMIDPSTSLALTVAAMLLLVALLRLGCGELTRPPCPLCGSRSSRHSERCPWHAHESDDWS
jgi:hypothetical protein